MGPRSSVTNQTLDRGLVAMTLIATASEPPTVTDIAAQLGIHRSMAYRVVRTLELHGFARRDDTGRCHPGHALSTLSRGVERSLRELARPELERLAQTLGMTAFLAVASGDDVITIDTAEPAGTDSVVSYKPGTRHPLEKGAPGLALLAGGPPRPAERPSVTRARSQGWAYSSGEVIAGLGSLATWVRGPTGDPIAALACLFPGEPPDDPGPVVAELTHSAKTIGAGTAG